MILCQVIGSLGKFITDVFRAYLILSDTLVIFISFTLVFAEDMGQVASTRWLFNLPGVFDLLLFTHFEALESVLLRLFLLTLLVAPLQSYL